MKLETDVLPLLRGSSDEDKLAGLLLLTKLWPSLPHDQASTQALMRQVLTAITPRFLHRLLRSDCSSDEAARRDSDAVVVGPHCELALGILDTMSTDAVLAASPLFAKQLGVFCHVIAQHGVADTSTTTGSVQAAEHALGCLSGMSRVPAARPCLLQPAILLVLARTAVQGRSDTLQHGALNMLHFVLPALQDLADDGDILQADELFVYLADQYAAQDGQVKLDVLRLLIRLASYAEPPGRCIRALTSGLSTILRSKVPVSARVDAITLTWLLCDRLGCSVLLQHDAELLELAIQLSCIEMTAMLQAAMSFDHTAFHPAAAHSIARFIALSTEWLAEHGEDLLDRRGAEPILRLRTALARTIDDVLAFLQAAQQSGSLDFPLVPLAARLLYPWLQDEELTDALLAAVPVLLSLPDALPAMLPALLRLHTDSDGQLALVNAGATGRIGAFLATRGPSLTGSEDGRRHVCAAISLLLSIQSEEPACAHASDAALASTLVEWMELDSACDLVVLSAALYLLVRPDDLVTQGTASAWTVFVQLLHRLARVMSSSDTAAAIDSDDDLDSVSQVFLRVSPVFLQRIPSVHASHRSAVISALPILLPVLHRRADILSADLALARCVEELVLELLDNDTSAADVCRKHGAARISLPALRLHPLLSSTPDPLT